MKRLVQALLLTAVVPLYVVALGALGALTDCKPGTTPVQVADAGGQAVNSGCTWLEGVTSNTTVLSVCATIEEIALIANVLAPLLDDGQTHQTLAGCTHLPNTNVCATKEQLGVGIMAVLERRRSRLAFDGGVK